MSCYLHFFCIFYHTAIKCWLSSYVPNGPVHCRVLPSFPAEMSGTFHWHSRQISIIIFFQNQEFCSWPLACGMQWHHGFR